MTSLRARLPRTWPVFFARHGNFTPVQQQAIPPILAGQNTLIIAATAAGKTEAAIAPVLERIFQKTSGQTATIDSKLKRGICILYLCPTRALVRDLYERLRDPLVALELSLVMKTGDTGPVSITRPPTVLISTPESTDSLLTRAPRLLTQLQAVILDEIHLFDGGPRGDHLRCLLRRIEIVRRYHQQQTDVPSTPLQRVALSATVPDPQGVADRYLHDRESDHKQQPATIVSVPGKRELDASIESMDNLDDLAAILTERTTGNSRIRKTLLFCNTRNEVEQTASFLRANLGYDATVFAHYSNLDASLRLEVENGFAEAAVALCVSTSTLELGIDIGSIDDVVLIGPPPTLQSFLQRIGRGGRRTGITRVLCLARTQLEAVQFQALVHLAEAPADPGETQDERPYPAQKKPVEGILPSVLVQQIFSTLKQSPTGAIRLADLARVAPEPVEDEILRAILNHLTRLKYLRSGRLGEWRPGPALDELADAHEIYSNIGSDVLSVTLVDAFSGRPLAQTDQGRAAGEVLQLAGRSFRVVWQDRYRLGVERIDSGPLDEEMRFHTAPFALPYDVGQALARWVGLASGQVALVNVAEGCWLFHFWGEQYGALLQEIFQFHYPPTEESAPVTAVNEHCLFVPARFSRLPTWDESIARRGLYRLLPRLEEVMELGRFHSLLPPDLAQKTVVARFDPPFFQHLYTSAELVVAEDALQQRLEQLLV